METILRVKLSGKKLRKYLSRFNQEMLNLSYFDNVAFLFLKLQKLKYHAFLNLL